MHVTSPKNSRSATPGNFACLGISPAKPDAFAFESATKDAMLFMRPVGRYGNSMAIHFASQLPFD